MSKELELPPVITALLKAQQEYDSNAFSLQFTNDAIVHDEAKTYYGIAEIKQWNEQTNQKYRITLQPINFTGNEKESVLTAMMTGNFDGSPIAINYNFTFENEKIKSLTIGT